MEDVTKYDDDYIHRIALLVAGHIRKELNAREELELQNWIDEKLENKILFDQLCNRENIDEHLRLLRNIQTEKRLVAVKKRISFSSQAKKSKKPVLLFAASFIIIVMAAWFLLQNKKNELPSPASQTDISPASNKATLILSNGGDIMLTDSAGAIITEDNIQIASLNPGEIVYSSQNGRAFNHILHTPKGGHYRVLLPDGSRVWLNASSSLNFPSAFSDSLRMVILKGEAYFEIAKKNDQPFIVELDNDLKVEAIGTHFCIRSYPGDVFQRTLLLEGLIKIHGLRQQIKPLPGQAVIEQKGKLKLDKNIDTIEAVAWKNGLFIFRDEEIHAIMDELSRWYDVDIKYADNISGHFSFSISRNEPLSKILHLLSETKSINFRVENKTVYVLASK